MQPVAIIGRAFSFLGSPKISLKGKDVWAMNAGAMHYPITAALQIHIYPYVLEGEEKYHKWLRELTVPVYMRFPRPEYPTAVPYPLEEVKAMLPHIQQGVGGLKEIQTLTSSVAYLMALAVLQGRPQIDVYGIELAKGTEYEKQREMYLFWVGFAGGRGIPLNIYCGNDMFQQPLYGDKLNNNADL